MARFWLIACMFCTWELLVAVECAVTLMSPASQPSPRHSPTPAPHSMTPRHSPTPAPHHSPTPAPHSMTPRRSSTPAPHSMTPRHSPTPAPHSGGSDCGAMVYNMMDCAPYLANGGKETKPESMCCSGFKNIMKKNNKCLCAALKSTADLGISLNITRAKTLTSACGVSYHLPKCHIDSNPPQPSPSPANPSPKHHVQSPSKSKAPKSAPATPAPAPSKASSSLSTSLAVLSTLISCFVFLLYESL